MKGKKIFRCMPVLVALCVLLEGMFFMTITKPGHVPDIWTHVYRIDSILNGGCNCAASYFKKHVA